MLMGLSHRGPTGSCGSQLQPVDLREHANVLTDVLEQRDRKYCVL